MELKSIFCPNCGASLEVEDGLDTFFCKHCSNKILLQGQSKAAYDAKVRIKQMEHMEKLQEKRDAQERYKMESKQKDFKKSQISFYGGFGAMMVLLCIWGMVGNAGAKRHEQELQAVVDQIIIDIENQEFAAAYIKANSLYWDNSWTSKGEDKWDAIRSEIIKQIEEAEKRATGTTTNPSDKDEDGG